MKGDVSALYRATQFLDTWLDYRYNRITIPGFVVTIAHEGEVVFQKACGYANLERQVAMSADHLFRVASHSKTFAATCVMQLAEEKLLDIDEPVANYVKWLESHEDKRMSRITARQLMCHSAGVIRDGKNADYWQMLNSFPDQEEFKKQILETELVLQSNLKMKYSNYGYSLLGCLVEAVSGLPFNEYVQKQIIEPLKLKETGPEFDERILPFIVTGYSRRESGKRLPLEEKTYTRAMSAATGFYSNASDLCKYFHAQFVGSGKLLSDESKREMQRTQWRVQHSDNEEYGLGVDVEYNGDRRLFGHGGGFPGQRTKTCCDPEQRLIVVILTNCIDGESRNISKGVLSVIDHFEKSGEAADPETIDELRRFEGTFRSLWGDVSIVENGRKLIAVNPDGWFPFGHDAEPQILDYVDQSTLKVARTNGYGNLGELVHYDFEGDGKTKTIRYGGSQKWIDSEYQKVLETRINREALASST
ncbi:MAG: serine hydrolase domain-containing protein [Candidatus Melainabacteria bacterium]|nr:serine hydrolase domain-containing protein [Candidatus Melainabacteria bacterium]